MNYIQRAQIAQHILTAARDADVIAVTSYGYQDVVTIQTYGPIDGFTYAPVVEGGHPWCTFERDGVTVNLTYVPDEAVTA